MKRRRRQVGDYTVGWICALPIELAAAQEMLDEEDEGLAQDNSDDNYTLGRIGRHNVVLACLPAGQMGTQSAATVAARMRSKFTSIRYGIMVGIGGGVPSVESDIRLGDVVISQPYLRHGGVVQYDFGKTGADGHKIRTGWLNAPPSVLLHAVSELRALHYRGRSNLPTYLSTFDRLENFGRNPAGPDVLFEATYNHIGGATCEHCSKEKEVKRIPRKDQDVVIHYGTIASGNQVMKNGITRDRISAELDGVMCFEMEAAGLMNDFPCLVIRGICDYADSHKNKRWQPYAAATAAACAKELLSVLSQAQVANSRPVGSKDKSTNRNFTTVEVARSLHFSDIESREHQIHHDTLDSYDWIWTQTSFNQWVLSGDGPYWISGRPGSGKSTLVSYIVHHPQLQKLLQQYPIGTTWTLLSFFFDFRAGKGLANSFEGLLRSLLHQILQKCPTMAESIAEYGKEALDPNMLLEWDFRRLRSALMSLLSNLSSNIFLFIDGLDEYAGNQLELLDFFAALTQSKQSLSRSIKLCFASRPDPLFHAHLHACNGLQMQDFNYSSISLYSSHRLEPMVNSHPDLAVLVERIAKSARGVFLWARLASDALLESWADGHNKEELIEKLDTLPSDVERLYKQTLTRIKAEYRREASIMLQLVAFACKTICLEDLYVAVQLALDPNGSLIGIFDENKAYDYSRKMKSFTRDLLELSQNSERNKNQRDAGVAIGDAKVLVLHKTVTTFIRRLDWVDDFNLIGQTDRVLGDELWLSICARWINVAHKVLSLRAYQERHAGIGLQGYVLDYTLQHAALMESQMNRSSLSLLDSALSGWMKSRFEVQDAALYSNPLYARHRTALSVAAACGLYHFCRDKLDAGADINEFGGKALMCAIVSRSLNVVQLFLDRGVEVGDDHILNGIVLLPADIVKALWNIRRPRLLYLPAVGKGAAMNPTFALHYRRHPQEELSSFFLEQGVDGKALSPGFDCDLPETAYDDIPSCGKSHFSYWAL